MQQENTPHSPTYLGRFHDQVASVFLPLSFPCLGILPTFLCAPETMQGAGVGGQWRGGIGVIKRRGGGGVQDLQGLILSRAPLSAVSFIGGLRWTPWEGMSLRCRRLLAPPHPKAEEGQPASHLRLCLRSWGERYPVLFLHTPSHTNRKASKRPAHLKMFSKSGVFGLLLTKEGRKENCWLQTVQIPLFMSMSTFLSFFLSLVTLGDNGRLCLLGSWRLTHWCCSHSSLSLPRHFGGQKFPPFPKIFLWRHILFPNCLWSSDVHQFSYCVNTQLFLMTAKLMLF